MDVRRAKVTPGAGEAAGSARGLGRCGPHRVWSEPDRSLLPNVGTLAIAPGWRTCAFMTLAEDSVQGIRGAGFRQYRGGHSGRLDRMIGGCGV